MGLIKARLIHVTSWVKVSSKQHLRNPGVFAPPDWPPPFRLTILIGPDEFCTCSGFLELILRHFASALLPRTLIRLIRTFVSVGGERISVSLQKNKQLSHCRERQLRINAIVPLNIKAFHWIDPQRLLNQPQSKSDIKEYFVTILKVLVVRRWVF